MTHSNKHNELKRHASGRHRPDGRRQDKSGRKLVAVLTTVAVGTAVVVAAYAATRMPIRLGQATAGPSAEQTIAEVADGQAADLLGHGRTANSLANWPRYLPSWPTRSRGKVSPRPPSSSAPSPTSPSSPASPTDPAPASTTPSSSDPAPSSSAPSSPSGSIRIVHQFSGGVRRGLPDVAELHRYRGAR